MKKRILKISVFVLILTGLVLYALNYWNNYSRERKVLADEIKRKAMYDKILDSASTSPTSLSVDYSKQITTGSPLIFGGAGTPPLEHEDAWNKISESGVTVIRTDLAMNWMVRNITLEDYKNNINDIQNVDNWNMHDLNKIRNLFIEAKKRDIKTIGIVDYSPPWLTFDNTDFGVPRDWEVFEDLVKKNYAFHRNYLDYVEIWNEANHPEFLTLGNSNLSRVEAYEKIFYHAAKAIREVDNEVNDGKRILIGGPVDPSPTNTSLLEKIISNKDTRKEIDFISYHNYDYTEPSWEKYKSILSQNQMSNYPIYLTEWNIDGRNNIDNPKKTAYPAIIYTGNVFVEFLKMGLTGANYYSVQAVKENGPFLGYYKWENGQAKLLPQARTWRILSKQMGLGQGESKIYGVNITEKSEKQNTNLVDVALEEAGMIDKEINTVGFINTFNQRGVALVNDSTDARNTEIKLANTGLDKFVNVKVYYANAGNEAKTPVYEGLIKAEKGNIRFSFYVPAETVMGIVFEEEKEWFRVFKK